MRIRRSLPMSDPGQFQTTQAAARNTTQGLNWRTNLHHGNHPGMLKDRTRWSILTDIKNGSENAVKNTRIDITLGYCVKVEKTTLYMQMLLTNWSKIWRKKMQYGAGPRLIVNAQCQGHSLWKRIVIEVANIDTWDRKCLIKYSLYYLFLSYHMNKFTKWLS